MIARRQWESAAEVFLCSGYPTQLTLSLVLAAFIAPQDGNGSISLLYLALVSALDTVALLALIVWLIRRRGETLRGVLFGHQPLTRGIGVGLAIAPLLVVGVSALMWTLRGLWPGLQTVPDNPLEGLAGSTTGAVVMLVVSLIAGGVREEVQRGFLLHRFRHDLGGPVVGLLLTSLSFGLGHVIQGQDAMITTAVLGALWGIIFLRRRSITPTIVSHAVFNGTQVLAAFLQRAYGISG
ncbi:MAG: CPBP family intramembrane metalloprotease [Acidobacteria bacterium]|nr:CPBP family intramembrane metalloprotease [Acidobacteriota bacterium]